MVKKITKKKSNAGRPTKLTAETLTKLEQAWSIGCSDVEACFFAGIYHTVLYNYKNKNPEYVERKELLKSNPVLKARKSVFDGLADPSLAFKFLERKLRKEFGPAKIQVEHMGTLDTKVKPDLSELSDKELEMIEQIIEKTKPES